MVSGLSRYFPESTVNPMGNGLGSSSVKDVRRDREREREREGEGEGGEREEGGRGERGEAYCSF